MPSAVNGYLAGPIALALETAFWFSLPRIGDPTAGRSSRPSHLYSRTGPIRMNPSPMQTLAHAVRQHGLVRFVEHFQALFPTTHLKDLIVDETGPDREIVVGGHRVVNFGSDSFLGLGQAPRVQEAVVRRIR